MKTDLWSDKNFIEKRIGEQYDYFDQLTDKYEDNLIDGNRFMELRDSALFILHRFQDRWNELNERETIERLSDTANFIG